MRTILVSVLASAITSVCVLLVGAELIAPPRAEAQTSIIQARQLQIVDGAGHLLASFGDVGGDASLLMYDHHGTVRVSVFDYGVALRDEHGVMRSMWATSTASHPLDGPTMLDLWDGDGTLLARLSERPNGLAALEFADGTGKLIQTSP
jgi:hypothetical protein